MEGGQTNIIRSPEDAAKVVAGFIGEDDREVFFVMRLNTKTIFCSSSLSSWFN
ncbi:hypothetical protein [Alkalihalobacillus sp. TS-13]|uniref:hypothetical protein n=1 Tax=Alkalihalobacillus sp. TS-13 TaxID=2842455 RepID=UPI001C88DABB|nr:hypothetical protein [Alkalihalobacillus sp. TS-13]